MIIDEILDLKDNYKSKIDLNYVYTEAKEFGFDYIITALEQGNNKDLQVALCKYIDDNNYNTDIKKFINSTIFMRKQRQKTYYFVEDDNYGQHGDFIETIQLNDLQYNYIEDTRLYNGKRGFITNSYMSALYYTQD